VTEGPIYLLCILQRSYFNSSDDSMEVEEKERDKTPHPHRFIDIRI
jgi:hypothetical protein